MRKTKKSECVVLSAKEMRRLPKPKAGFIAFAPRLFGLARERGDALYIKDLDVDVTLALLDEYKAAFGAISDARIALEQLLHAQFLRASLLWQTMLRIYRHARAVARDDAMMRFAIADFGRFMKHAKKPKRRKPRSA